MSRRHAAAGESASTIDAGVAALLFEGAGASAPQSRDGTERRRRRVPKR